MSDSDHPSSEPPVAWGEPRERTVRWFDPMLGAGAGRRVAFADADVRDAAGVVLATATGSCLVMSG